LRAANSCAKLHRPDENARTFAEIEAVIAGI
jgi:hypothetical protein